MKIILREDIAKLGKIGDVVNVRDGYARNFLLPKGLAFVATEGAMKRIEALKRST
ncbi:MAG: 50S ribosomal protein L9, partial [Ignavibacteria bacterium]|nr:50S ribosomal protein L9 [Ignavibacteria bacterium]